MASPDPWEHHPVLSPTHPLDARTLTGLLQPDARSCGACCVVAARAVRDPAYAAWLHESGLWDDEVLGTHRRLTALVDHGRPGVPWLRAIGTPPWAVARRLRSTTGRGWRTRWRPRATAMRAVRTALEEGLPVPVYVGSKVLPRHVLLAVGLDPGTDEVLAYDPARGRVLALSWLTSVGWPRVWAVVLPTR